MELFTLLIGLIVIILLSPVIKRYFLWRQFVNIIEKIPGDKAYPIIGTSYIFWGVDRGDIFDVIKIRLQKYQGISRGWILNHADIALAKPEYVEKVLSSQKNLTKGVGYNFELRKWLGNGLITSTGEQWHSHRKVITPTFHFSILEGFCDTFAEQCQILVQKLEPFCNTGKPIDIFNFVNHCALDIICETAMGTTMDAQEKGESEYVQSVAEIAKINRMRFFNPLYQFDWIFNLSKWGEKSRRALKVLHNFTDKVIKERKELRKRLSIPDASMESDEFGKKRRLAFLDLILQETENRPFFTDQDIREEVDTFMFAGHDTTTVSTCFALFLLGHHPEVQEKLYEEQLSIFSTIDELPTHKQLNEMKYLDRVMKECIRVYPTVPAIGRRVTEEFEVAGYKIPVGCMVTVSIYGLTRDERYFPDPEKFDPDRFLPENSQNRHPYAFIPFSAGPRNCIGQKFAQLEEKVMLSTFIRNFKFKSSDSRKDMKFIQEIVSRPINGIKLIIEKRN